MSSKFFLTYVNGERHLLKFSGATATAIAEFDRLLPVDQCDEIVTMLNAALESQP